MENLGHIFMDFLKGFIHHRSIYMLDHTEKLSLTLLTILNYAYLKDPLYPFFLF